MHFLATGTSTKAFFGKVEKIQGYTFHVRFCGFFDEV